MLACNLAKSVLVSASVRSISASVLTITGRLIVISPVAFSGLVLAFNRTVHCITLATLVIRH